VPLEIVQAALLIASSRRRARDHADAPLAPVRSLHYFLPVIDELSAAPPDPAYLEHLTRHFAEASTNDQKSADAGAPDGADDAENEGVDTVDPLRSD
jgi:hypothetical protein